MIKRTPFGAVYGLVSSVHEFVGVGAAGVVDDGVGVGDATLLESLLATEDVAIILDDEAEEGSIDEEATEDEGISEEEAIDKDDGVAEEEEEEEEEEEVTDEDRVSTEDELATEELSAEELVEEDTTRLLLDVDMLRVFEELMVVEVPAGVEERTDDTGFELQAPNGL
jgi:hypothetical protein